MKHRHKLGDHFPRAMRFKRLAKKHRHLFGAALVLAIAVGLVLLHEKKLAAVSLVAASDKFAELIAVVITENWWGGE